MFVRLPRGKAALRPRIVPPSERDSTAQNIGTTESPPGLCTPGD